MNSEPDTTDAAAAGPAGRRRLGKRAKLGIVLVVLSFLIFFAIPAIAFLPLAKGAKWYVGVGVLVFCYGIQYAGLYLAGREVAGPIMAWFWKWLPWRKSSDEDVQLEEEAGPAPGDLE